MMSFAKIVRVQGSDMSNCVVIQSTSVLRWIYERKATKVCLLSFATAVSFADIYSHHTCLGIVM